MRRHARAKPVGELDCPRDRPVGHPYIGKAALLQRLDHRPCRAAGAQDHRRPGFRPLWRALVEVRRKARGIRIAAAKHAVLEPQRVHRADLFRSLVAPDSRAKRRFLVRDRDVAADKAAFLQRREETRSVSPAPRRSLRNCRRCRICSASSRGLLASANARWGDRRRRPFSRSPQPSIAPIARNSLSTASRGRPTMVK